MNTQETAVQTLMEGHNRLADAIDALFHDRERELRGLVPKLTAEKAALQGDVEKLKEDLGQAQRELAIHKDLVDTLNTALETLRQALHDSRQENHMLESKLEAAGAEVALLREELENAETRCKDRLNALDVANRHRSSAINERNVLRDKAQLLERKLNAAELRLVEVFEERDDLKKSLDEAVERYNNSPNQLQAVRLKTAELENAEFRREVESLRRRLRERPDVQKYANMRDKWLDASDRLARVRKRFLDFTSGATDVISVDQILELCATNSSAS